ncbi:MAG TPA: DUF2933 domain-containing protein [Candidatus Nanoarchaeia archaeon]|nr:DUF2933 domain-containing protein [Candidatus Nanoarchaeia archaeon]
MNSWKEKLHKHHGLVMVLCCLIPILLVVGASFFGLQRSALVWIFLLLCPLTHYWMMRGMHDKPSGENKERKAGEEKPACH